MTTITLTDAAGTPVNRPFSVIVADPDGSVWKDYATNGGLPIGAGTVTMSLRENSNGTNRLAIKLSLPTLETGDSFPVPTKAFDCIASAELVFPSRSSLQNRKDLKAMFNDLLSDALVTAAVENFVRPV